MNQLFFVLATFAVAIVILTIKMMFKAKKQGNMENYRIYEITTYLFAAISIILYVVSYLAPKLF
ncbi:hypothetical protein G7081_04460 [Vagococcus coleopterorum]|uniref:Uncharacterized protein n=1 Tax=Vagococcus coleopterorum TaxID=2714946 RepID=A0A6G8AN26_9ENTE|nr:hypothetical protein [Vagococcus coleopterorum]QIL46369.1 hypothetical protein G7081_04460 [Vagococcus coleopterorum]